VVFGLQPVPSKRHQPTRLISPTPSPEQNAVVVPARHAYSHSASVGNRTFLPARFESHPEKATASFQLTTTTG
jgi:hypothetical protein